MVLASEPVAHVLDGDNGPHKKHCFSKALAHRAGLKSGYGGGVEALARAVRLVPSEAHLARLASAGCWL